MKKALFVAALALSTQAQVFEFDQGFDSGASGGNGIANSQTLGQTFTVGIEGTLREVHLNLFRSGSVQEDIVFRIIRPSNRETVAAQVLSIFPFHRGWRTLP